MMAALRLGVLWFALALLTAIGAPAAFADTVSYDIETGSAGLTGYVGPFVNLSINRTDNTHATFTFTALTSPGDTYLYTLGGEGVVGLNINAGSFIVGAITETNPDHPGTNGLANFAGAANENGWGSFNLTVDNFDGYQYRATSVSFDVTNTSGTWANAGSVLTGNSLGSVAAAHVFVVDGPAPGVACIAACTTAFAATTGGNGLPQHVVPEPSSIILLGSGFAAFAVCARKKAINLQPKK